MKKALILAGILLLSAIPIQSEAKSVHFRHKTRDREYARSMFPQVIGDLEASMLTLSIFRYTGVVQICVLDNYGNIIQTHSEVIQGKKTIDLDLEDLAEGEYSVTMTLGDNVYWGIIDLT